MLIDGDPTANIADIRKVALVLKGDTAYYPSEIFEALGIKPFAAPVKVGGQISWMPALECAGRPRTRDVRRS